MTEPLFAILPGGVTLSDEPALRELAKRRDAMQPFYAVAILALTGMLERGELKGVSPDQIAVCIIPKVKN